MGDSGYLDASGRFWFCGRVAHCVHTADGPMYPDPLRSDFQPAPGHPPQCPGRRRTGGRQRPVIILEPHKGRMPRRRKAREALLGEIRQLAAANPLTADISDFLLHPGFPVDIRHNAKIFREKLAVWASTQVTSQH